MQQGNDPAAHHPLQQHAAALHQAWDQMGKAISSNINNFSRNLRPIQDLAGHAAGFLQHVQRELGGRLHGPAAAPQPAFAVSARSAQSLDP
jgi:hypothetical protein